MWEGLGTRVIYTYFILEQGQHSYSCSLVPRPTSSFDCLQSAKQIMASYTQAVGTIASFPTIAPPILANAVWEWGYCAYGLGMKP